MTPIPPEARKLLASDALAHLVTGILLCLTIVGIPLGVADFKMAGAALVPFGKEIVRTGDLAQPPPGAIQVSGSR